VLTYLCDVSAGGGTYFPKLDKRFMPRRGMAVIFFPCTVDGRLDPLALHTAEKAVDEKWVCQTWVRQYDFK
jgi:prolyl 4-hydroxylase